MESLVPERDRSPIDQRWVQHYCDTLLEFAKGVPLSPMHDAILKRVECAMDLLEAWQKRDWPKFEDERPT